MAYQLYLDNEFVNYLAFLSKKEDRLNMLKDFDGSEFAFSLNRENKDPFVVSKKQNIKIMKQLKEIANQTYFDGCNIIQTVRDIDNFETLSLYDQIESIFEAIKLFGRNARYSKFSPNLFTKSKKSLFNEDISIINESITGLVSYKRKI